MTPPSLSWIPRGDDQYVGPWKQALFDGGLVWMRCFVFDKDYYVARIYSAVDFYCHVPISRYWTNSIRKYPAIDDVKSLIDDALVRSGYILLSEKQMQTMELLA